MAKLFTPSLSAEELLHREIFEYEDAQGAAYRYCEAKLEESEEDYRTAAGCDLRSGAREVEREV